MSVTGQRPDGSRGPVEPLGPQGTVAKIEFWLRDRSRLPHLVRLLAWIDERGLRR